MSRYSQLYIERGEPTQDSERMRVRLYGFIARASAEGARGIYRLLKNEIAADLGRKVRVLSVFFDAGNLPDVLDAITIIRTVLYKTGVRGLAETWQRHVEQVLAEENVAYRIDSACVVHPLIDTEFDRNRHSALAALDDDRFGEARTDFEAAFEHLRKGEGKQAIRMMFPAVEVAAKVLNPGQLSRLEVANIKRMFPAKIEVKYAGNEPAIIAGRRKLEVLEHWIIASQPYRHGQAIQEPPEPPDDLVVLHLSTGAAFLRWMIEVHS